MLAKIQTLILVVILTAFIWVLAERKTTQTEEIDLTINLPILQQEILLEYISESGELVASPTRTVRLIVQGSAGTLQNAKNHGRFEIEMPNLEELPAEGSRDYTMDVVKQILQGQLGFEGGILKVREAKPSYLGLRATKMVRRTLPVKVRDAADNHELTVESIKPATMDALTLNESSAEATVRLTAEQQRLALRAAIKVSAEVRSRNRKVGEQLVEIKLAEAGGQSPVEISQPRLGLLMPLAMQCQFQVVIEPGNEQALESIRVRGSATALADYRRARYHLLLEVDEKDLKSENTVLSRPLQYFLPEAYRQEITLINPTQRLIRFHIEPLVGPEKVN